MEYKLKPISPSGIPEAFSKIELYRYLNEPEEAESICRDVLAIEPENQLALRLLGLSITDQFSGDLADRYGEVETAFRSLTEPYERSYYMGILHERRAKAQLQVGRPPHTVRVLLDHAMRCFEEAEKIRPQDNDDAILRWNRCVRLVETLPSAEREQEVHVFEAGDSPPI